MFTKGMPKPPTSGIKKGQHHKVTTEVKDMIRHALRLAGGEAYLVRQAEKNPAAFMALIGKIIPSEVKNNLSGNFTITWKK